MYIWVFVVNIIILFLWKLKYYILEYNGIGWFDINRGCM